MKCSEKSAIQPSDNITDDTGTDLEGQTWDKHAQCNTFVFRVNITSCAACCGAGKEIASIEDPEAIKMFLAQVRRMKEAGPPGCRSGRVPPGGSG